MQTLKEYIQDPVLIVNRAGPAHGEPVVSADVYKDHVSFSYC